MARAPEFTYGVQIPQAIYPSIASRRTALLNRIALLYECIVLYIRGHIAIIIVIAIVSENCVHKETVNLGRPTLLWLIVPPLEY